MPPLSRLARIQIAVLIIAGLVVSIFAGIRYVHLNRVVGVVIYTVDAHLPESGGIFTNAEVTYMGVPVGRVGTLALRSDGVTVPLILESSGPDIPANSVAVVANRSAIGEQYVDLRPQSGSGPFLHDGSVITKTSVPPPIEDVVSSALDFTSSIPIDDLHTVITQLGAAFNGQADNLTRLVDSLGKLSRAGVDSLPQAISLINSADSVLATQAAQSDQILAWSRSLDLITATLASSDPDLRRLLTTGTTSATQISTLIQRNGGDIGKVVGQLSEVAHTIAPTGYNIGNTFAMLSLLSAQGHTTAPGDGQIHFGVVLETNNPPACTQGYESTDAMLARVRREKPTFDINYDDFPFNTEAHCTLPFGNPTAVRGAQRVSTANPDTPQPWDSTPKKDPDKLNLNPLAQQLAGLMGVRSAG